MKPLLTAMGVFGLFASLVLPSCSSSSSGQPGPPAATAIQYLVVLFQENTSFDAYFGTYPVALNPEGSPPFEAKPGTPSVNGLTRTLLLFNPNTSNPFRISRLDSYTCDSSHKYMDEIQARNGGLMNKYVQFGAEGPGTPPQFCHQNEDGDFDTDMGYFDGNTVTALWNYAQHFAMGDNHFGTMPGESARGHQNFFRGDVTGALCAPANPNDNDRIYVPEGVTLPLCNGPVDSTDIEPPSLGPDGPFGVLGDDLDPFYDFCSESEKTTAFTGRNIGNLLTDAGVTWGYFMGGFADCSVEHSLEAWERATGLTTPSEPDYAAHYNAFQYFQSTANPMHLPPTSVAMVGHTDQANHLYDLSWFWEAADAGNLPTVSFLKAPQYQNGHPRNSDPLDEQVFLVETINRLQELPEWEEMAIIIGWDDSDGWYDHVMAPIINLSNTALDVGLCGAETQGPGTRCAYGPRTPSFVISPFAKQNYVSHALTDETSVLRFIEDNWLNGERISADSFDNFAGPLDDFFDFDGPRAGTLFLDPETGLPVDG